MMKNLFFQVISFACPVLSQAAIISVNEVGLAGDAAAIIDTGFGEDGLAFSDRTHEHNGAAFDAGSGLLSTTGATIVPLPTYLLGGDYVRFANNARDNVNYFATVLSDESEHWYLMVDNRLDGGSGNTGSPNTTDPVLMGTLDWVVLGGWERVDTGISPNGQADYIGVDEGGDSVGAGLGLNQFYSVYRYPIETNVVTVFNNGIGASNMIALVAGHAIPEPSSAGLFALALGAVFVRRTRRN